MSEASYVVEVEPRCVTLRDAIATPFALIALVDAPEHLPRDAHLEACMRGCLYDADGTRAELSVRAGGIEGDQVASIDPVVLPREQRGGTWLTGRTLYLGRFMNRYGPFVTETLSRYWLKDAGPFDHVVAYPFTHSNGNILVQDFHRYLAGLLDVPIGRMAVLRSQTVFDEIVVPEQLWTNNVQVNARMREIYGRIRDRHAGTKSAGRIFLSGAPSGRLANPLAVEEAFAGYGFRVLYPERVPIADQLTLYANCETLAGLSGSGMHNCLFARPGLLTIEVGDTGARARPPINQRIANELAQVDARFIPFGEETEPSIDPKLVRRNLRDILGERPRCGPVLLLRLRRGLEWLTGPRKARKRRKSQADLRGGS